MTQNFTELTHAAAEGLSFVENGAAKSPELKAKAENVITELARLETRSAALDEVLKAGTTLGVFGASQAGKSYLVSRMAAGRDGELATTWEGEHIDFLTHVNPQGQDKEATGFVTRFTHRAHPGIPGFPIEVRVFKETEIAMILVNSFFNDLDQDRVSFDLSAAALEAHLKACEKFIDESAENYVTLSDLVEVADYVATHSGGKLDKLNAAHPFWIKARNLAPRLSLEGRAFLFSFLWKGCKVFTLLYTTIARELLKLKGASSVYAPLDAFVERVNGTLMQKKSGTIINIISLTRLFDDKETLTVSLDDKGQDLATLPFAAFAAVSLEITFPLAGTCPIESFDVLDFPGARERRKDRLDVFTDDEKHFDGTHPTPYMQEQGTEFIRRGKVAYLFDRYARRREIDTLLFCIGVNAQQEVSSIVSILNGWIDLNAGRTPQERQRLSKTPLLCVLTRFDSVFERQIANIEAHRPTNTQREMQDAIEKISSQGWMQEWTPGKPFSHFFVARRPDLPSIGRWMRMENGREAGINPDYQSMVDKVCDELVADPLFTRHVLEPREALEAVLTSDGGVERITEVLLKDYQIDGQQREKVRLPEVATLASVIVDELADFALPEGDARALEMEKQGLALGTAFLQCNSVSRLFGQLRSFMELDPETLQHLYAGGYAAGSNARRFATEVMEAYLSALRDLARGRKAATLTAMLLKGWKRHLSNLAYTEENRIRFSFFDNGSAWKNDEEISRSFGNLLSRLSREIAALMSSERLHFKERLTAALEAHENNNARLDENLTVQCEIAARFISDFSTTLDVLYLDPGPEFKTRSYFKATGNDREIMELGFEVTEGGEARKEPLFSPVVSSDPYVPVPLIDGRARRFEFATLSGFMEALIYGMVTVNASQENARTAVFSREENRQICQVLDSLRTVL